MQAAITPIKTIQTIAAARYLNINKVMTEKTVKEPLNDSEKLLYINKFLFQMNGTYQMI